MTDWTGWLLAHLSLSLITGSCVILAALVLVTRTRDPVIRYRILSCTLPLLALLPLVQVATSEIATRPRWTHATATLVESPRATEQNGDGLTMWDGRGAAVGPLVANRGAEPSARTMSSWETRAAPAIGGVYLACAGVMMLIIFRRGVRTVRLVRRCGEVREPRVLAIWRALLRTRRGTPARTQLLQSSETSAPGCWGVVSPSVVLPTREVSAADAERLSLVLQHELVHVARRDVPAALAQQFVRAVFWFNPLVWIYSSMLSRYRELSCDAIVVRQTGKHQSYALALLEYCRPRPRARGLLGLAMAGGADGRNNSVIRRRLDMILNEQEHRSPQSSAPRRFVWALGILAVAGSVTAATVFGPGPMPVAQPEPQPTKEKLADKEPEAARQSVLRLIEGRLRLENSQRTPLELLKIELPPEGRSAESTLLLQRLIEGRNGAEAKLEGTLTDQETLVSGDKVKVRGNILLAPELVVNMPEGSRLRSVFRAEAIRLLTQTDPVEVTVERGEMRLLDDAGVSRIRLRLAEVLDPTKKAPEAKPAAPEKGAVKVETVAPPNGTLKVTISEDNGEVVMRFKATKADGTPAEIQAELDFKTGVPEGEKDPPSGAIRYRLFDADREEGKPLKVKMQWIYDLSKVGKEEGKDKGAHSAWWQRHNAAQ